MSIKFILIGIIAVVIIAIVSMYNSLVRLRTRVDEAWSDIDVQLKRRYDLIPNFINTVKGYATHEQTLLEKLTQERANAMSSGGVAKADAENALTGTLRTLFAVAENYPDLKANQNFLELQRELSDTENKIQAARRFYNTNVMELNTQVDTFPSGIIASWFNFTKREFFQIDEAEKAVVPVSF
jgi:LemA protein